jgi:hypothetical protein
VRDGRFAPRVEDLHKEVEAMRSSLVAMSAAVLAATLLFDSAAEARAKNLMRNACTRPQLEDAADNAGVQACLNQQTQDLIDGKKHIHYVACLPGGRMSCCQDLNETGARSCDPIAARSVLPEHIVPQTTVPLQAD